MIDFKELISQDNKEIYLNFEEFAEPRKIEVNNQIKENVLCVLDDSILEVKKTYKTSEEEGIYTDRKLLFVMQADLGCRPTTSQQIVIDDEYYLVISCGEALGMLEIELGANLG